MVVLKDENGFYFSEFKHFGTLGLSNMKASMVKPLRGEPCQVATFADRHDAEQTAEILAEKGVVVTLMNLCTVELGIQIDEMLAQIKMYEGLRPHWAKGYSDDSLAAQASTGALANLWIMLGVTNQTEAVAKIKKMTGELP